MPSERVDSSSESRVPQILIGTLIPSIIASISVLARMYSRGVLTRSWGLDDSLILISWLFGLILTIINCTFTKFGYGKHVSFQTHQQAATAVQLSYVSRIIYQFVLGSSKIGVCAFYLRIFTDRRSKILIYILSGFILMFSVPLTIYIVVKCMPVDRGWQGEPALCHSNSAPDFFLSAACNILADVLLLIFVVPRIIPLKMAIRQKVALLAVVSLSFLVIVAAVVRLLQVMQFNESTDRTWDIASITTWSAVEIDTGLFCASAPAIKPLIRRLKLNFMSSLIDRIYEGKVQPSCSGHIELESRNNHRMSTNIETPTVKIWGGDYDVEEMQTDDGNSTKEILKTKSGESGADGILKVVTIEVTGNRDLHEDDREDKDLAFSFQSL